MQVLKSSSQRTAVWMGGEHGGSSTGATAGSSNVNQGAGYNLNQPPNQNSSGSEHSSAAPPVLPRRKPPFPQQQPSSPTSESSAKSLDQVANAGFNYPKVTYGSPFRPNPSQPIVSSSKSSPTRPTTDLPYEAPPMHPDRRLSAGWHEVEVDDGGSGGSERLGMRIRGSGSPGTRTKMGRSKSMHHHPSPPPSIPAPQSSSSISTSQQQQLQQRRRPESVQLTPTRPPAAASNTMSYQSIFDDPPFPMRRSDSPASHHGSLSGLSSNSNTNKQSSKSIFDDPPRPLPQTPALTPSRPSQSPSRPKSPASILSLPPTSPSTSSKHEQSSPMIQIQKTLTQLQNKAGPKLDKARFKAEAGISKRGYVRGIGGKGDGEGLIGAGGDGEDGGYGDESGYAYGEEKDSGVYSASESDEDDRGVGRVRGLGSGKGDVNGHDNNRWKREEMLREKDSLKWPVGDGEGWKPL
jgi:hypothetical protein